MHWSMVGWSHHKTPIELREKLAFADEQAKDCLSLLRQTYPEAETVLLSTCNRVELFAASASDSQLPSPDELADVIAKQRGVSRDAIDTHAVKLRDAEVLRHLFRVAASLDSMIVGEAQILSQVKSAYEMACQAETAATLMHRAFQRASLVAKRISNETEIHKRRVSVPSVAVSEIASEFFERFDDKRILLIGAGEMGVETLRYLQAAGAKKIRIVNRNFERANDLAHQFQAKAEPWDVLNICLGEADLIVSTTSASEPIVLTEQFKALRTRGSKAVLILDLAVPRDFEPTIANLPDVYLFAIDDLQQVCERNIQARKNEWPKACQIVDSETERFLSEAAYQGSGPTIKKLREQAQLIKEEEYQRLIGKLQAKGIDPQVEKELAISFDRLVNKILHPPMQSLRDNADPHHHATLLDALKRLFQLHD